MASVSVVMPVFNGSLYLERAIRSVLNQTIDDFEFIIVDDGSTDLTEDVVCTFKDPRIKYLKQPNSGVGAALKRGCELAVGKYIARMDVDDICYPNRFKEQLNYLEKKARAVLVSSAVVYIDHNEHVIGRSFPYTNHNVIVKKLNYGSPICHPSVMMRRSAYEIVGGYKNLKLVEDLYLWRLLSKVGELHNLSSPLLMYRVLKNSVSHSIPASANKKLIQFLVDLDLTIDEREVAAFNQLYDEIKSSYINSNLVESQVKVNGYIAKLDVKVYNLFKKARLSSSVAAEITCRIKTLGSFFRLI